MRGIDARTFPGEEVPMPLMMFVEHDAEALVTDKPHCSDCFGFGIDAPEAEEPAIDAE